MRLTDSQATALEALHETHARGAKEAGVQGNTLEALANNGLVRTFWTEKPYRRLVGVLTEAGVEERDRRRV